MKTYSKYIWILVGLLIGVGLTGCQDKFPSNVESSDLTVLKSIKILNAGPEGNQVVEGVVDENTKRIKFPRILPESDLKNLKFEATMSDGAQLEKDTYELNFEEGESEKTIVIKVVNNKRFREYFATVRLIVPVYGAEWSKAKIYDFSANPMPNDPWPNFKGLVVRGAGFSGKWVAIPARMDAHVISTEEILKGNDKPEAIKLNLEGVPGNWKANSTFATHSARVIGEHIYMASLSSKGLPRIYHWVDPKKAPDILMSDELLKDPNFGYRFGESLGLDLDEQGNGFIFLGVNDAAGMSAFARLTVKNWTKVSDPILLTGFPFIKTWSFYNRIEYSDQYLVTSLQDGNIYLAGEKGDPSVIIPKGILPENAGDPRIINFAGERYLLTLDGARSANHGTPALRLYNITKGKTAKEALEIVASEGVIEKLFEHSIGGGPNAAPGARSGFDIIKDAEGNDSKLLLFGAVTDSGFAVIEIPKKELILD